MMGPLLPQNDRFGFFLYISCFLDYSHKRNFMHTPKLVELREIENFVWTLGNQDVSYYEYIASMGSSEQQLLINGINPWALPQWPSFKFVDLGKVYTKNIGIGLNFFLITGLPREIYIAET